MANTIEPHKITTPIQLLAAWFIMLVALEGTLLTAIVKLTQPVWLQAALGVFALVLPCMVIGVVFLMQTKYRPQIMNDKDYSEYKKRLEKEFKDFNPENKAPTPATNNGKLVLSLTKPHEEFERERIEKYKTNYGLFVIHSWRPSLTPGQIADITISLHQHGDSGPLTDGKIEKIEYQLGPKFFNHPVEKTNRSDNFRFNVSAYKPMLCFACVHFNDGRPAIFLDRYIDFS